MAITKYYELIAKELNKKANNMGIGFSTRKLSVGENREIVGDFLTDNLPKAFKVDLGFILSMDGEFSNQEELLIVDHMFNSPLFLDSESKVWLAESVYAMIDVKSQLTNTELEDIILKCRKFKRMRRYYQSIPSTPRTKDSLFIIWGGDGGSSETLKSNIIEVLRDVPVEEQPDFIIVPNSMIVTCGSYRKMSQFGQDGSKLNQRVISDNPGKSYEDIFEIYEFIKSEDNSILMFLTWLTAWLKVAGYRSAPIEAYLKDSQIFENLI